MTELHRGSFWPQEPHGDEDRMIETIPMTEAGVQGQIEVLEDETSAKVTNK